MGNLKSTLTIALKDDVTSPANKIAGALKNAQAQIKAIASAGISDRLGQQLTKFGVTAADIQKVGAAWKDYATTAKLAANASDWTKAQKSQVRAWENATVSSIRNVVRAEEQQVLAQALVRRAADRAADRAGPLKAHAPARLSGGGHTMFAGPAVLAGTKDAVKAGADFQSEIVKMRAAGIRQNEINAAVEQTDNLAAKYTNVKRASILERYKELRSVLTHPDETPHMLEPVIKANAAMNALDRSGHMAEGLAFAVKGAEVLGLAQDPKRFEAYLDAFIRAQQVMGKTITPEQQFEFAKYSKASGATLSDRFKMTTAVSLGQELGGSTTGVSVDQFVKQVTGGFQGSQHSAAKEFVALGLAKKGDFTTTKTGEIKGLKHGRKVAGADLAQTDPDTWVDKFLMPAFEKAGIVDQNAQIAQVRRMFPSGRSADLVTKLITQRESFRNHAKLYDDAQGTNAVENNQSDPYVALNSLSTSLSNLGGVLTSPVMANAAGVMSSMATSIAGWGASLAAFNKEHPDFAKAAGGAAIAGGVGLGGVLSYQLLSGFAGGFGLKGSAVALTGAAEALTAAAAAQGGGLPGAVKPGAGKMPLVPLVSALTLPLLLGGDTPSSQTGLVKNSVEKQTADWRTERDFTLDSNGTFGNNFGTNNSFKAAPTRSPFPGGAQPAPMFDYTELKVHAAEAGDAGLTAGEAFRSNLKAKLDQAVIDVSTSVAQMRDQLNFSASPTITPKFGPAPTVGKGASLNAVQTKQAGFSDGNNFQTV